ncbi:hypothetical protein ACFQ9V_10945 [Leifsonia sp. NPDC056665]|uniref:hypothetical protein n=1 Tax=Leifsonia sp. NPDC056665 TaxID=3345901 RepID=UPI0036A3DDD9
MSKGMVVSIVLVSAGMTLSACASAPPTGKALPSMTSPYPTPDESRATTLELFEATRELIGGTAWETDGDGYGTCTLPDGSAGANYTRQDGLIGATIDSVAVAKQIAELWESGGDTGVTVKLYPDGVGYDVTDPVDARRRYLHVTVTDYSATIHMSGGCIPGDADELTHALVS